MRGIVAKRQLTITIPNSAERITLYERNKIIDLKKRDHYIMTANTIITTTQNKSNTKSVINKTPNKKQKIKSTKFVRKQLANGSMETSHVYLRPCPRNKSFGDKMAATGRNAPREYRNERGERALLQQSSSQKHMWPLPLLSNMQTWSTINRLIFNLFVQVRRIEYKAEKKKELCQNKVEIFGKLEKKKENQLRRDEFELAI